VVGTAAVNTDGGALGSRLGLGAIGGEGAGHRRENLWCRRLGGGDRRWAAMR
jgi:hypothetical protein